MPSRRRQVFTAVTAAALLAGCVTTEDRTAARKAWGDCIATAVSRMDDGRTDPISIAYGVSPQCAVQYSDLAEAMIADNITENGQNQARQMMRDQEIKLITAAVLTHRAAQKRKS